jgi:peptidoglycan/LPS O-acetylase OafA/YrhL
MKFLAMFTLTPILCFAFQDLGSEHAGMDWLTTGYAAWPMMAGPVLMLLLFIRYRELIRDPRKGANFSQTIKIVAFLFLIPNVFLALGYSWLAVVSVLAILTILVADRQLKKQARA